MQKPRIWGKETLSETCLLNVFFFLCVFGTKTLKSMESTLNGKTKHNQKRVFWAFLSYIHTKPLKCMKRKQQFSQKTCILRFLSSLRTKNAKIHAKYTIWENENKLREKCIMSVLSFLGTKTLKRMNSILYGETEQDYQKRVFWVYSRW